MSATIRRRTFEILDVASPDDAMSRLADIALITIISLNVVAAIVESIASIRAQRAAFFAAFGNVPAAMWWAIITMTTLATCPHCGKSLMRRRATDR